MSDPLIDLADAVVSGLTAQFPTVTIGGKAIHVSYEWTDDAGVELSDQALGTPLVWVVDAKDVAESQHSIPFEDYQILVIVQMKRPGSATAAAHLARELAGLSADIRAWGKSDEETLQLTAGGEIYTCVKAERPSARNHEEWHRNKRFYSEIVLTFRKV